MVKKFQILWHRKKINLMNNQKLRPTLIKGNDKMKKYLLYAVAIVAYSIVVVLMRHSDAEIPNWVFWALSFVLIAALGWIGSIGKGDDADKDEPENKTTENAAMTDAFNKLEKIIKESDWPSKKKNLAITMNTNFARDLKFDGIAMAEVILKMEKEFHVDFPDDSPLMQRPSEDVDFTVGELLTAFSLLEKKENSATQATEAPSTQTDGSEAVSTESNLMSFDIKDLLPSFEDMDNEPTPEEILRVAALTDTMLHLTFKNPCPIEQDPVFKAVLQANTQSLMECLESGKLKVGDHEELKQAFKDKHPEKVAEALGELDYWNMRMIEHAVLMKGLGPKPAYNCLSPAYSIVDKALTPLCVLIVNYAHLLLRFKMLKLANPTAISDVTMALKQASLWLGFDEGRNYTP